MFSGEGGSKILQAERYEVFFGGGDLGKECFSLWKEVLPEGKVLPKPIFAQKETKPISSKKKEEKKGKA